jgi:hypothetical protein
LFIALLVIPELIITSQAYKKNKKSSPVWVYTRIPLEDKNLDLFYYSYYEQDPIAQRALYSSKNLLAITKHINWYHLLIIIKKTMNKKQEIMNQ